MKKKFKVSYVVTWTYPEIEIEDLGSNLAVMEYMRKLEDGKLQGEVQRHARWSISGVNGDSH